MRSVPRRLFVLACVLGVIVGLGQSVALAGPTPLGPVLPGQAPLTGVSFTPAGDITHNTGLTWTYSGLTSGLLAQFNSLEWGPAAANSVYLSMNGLTSDPGAVLTFNPGASNLAGGTAVWTGSQNYTIEQPAETIPLLTRLTMTARDANNVPITGFIGTSGYADGATVPLTGNFSVNLLFEVSTDGGTTWTPAGNYFDAQHNFPNNTIQSSFLGGFFYTLANVPVASVSPPSLGFGNEPLGQTSAAQVVTVQNTGNADLQVQPTTISGDFAISSDTCSNQTVPAGSTCTIGVTFAPTQTGPRTGTLTITDNAADSPQTVSLGGTGTQPVLSLSPPLAFGNQAVGTTSAAQTVTIANLGSGALHVSNVSVTGNNAGDFSASPSGCGDVATGGTCTISVTFTPSASGARSAALSILSDAPSSPDQLALSGTGRNSRLALSPNPMDFGNVLFGQSKTLTLTFSNSGDDPTHLTGPPAMAGPDPGDFSFAGANLTCPSDNNGPFIPAHGTCTLVGITFTPGAVGARSATFTFPNDSSDGPAALALSGNGTNAGISVGPPTLSFPAQGTGTTSSAQPVVVTSSGTSPLTVSSATASGPFQVSTDGCSGAGPINPGNTCTVQVVFAPTATGPASGMLTITSDGGTKTVALSGTGIAVADLGLSVGASPNPIKSNSKATLTYTVTLKNAGPNAASGMVINDPLPSFTQFQSLSPPAGVTCSTPAVGASGTVKCSLATLNAGASVQFQILVRVVATKAMTITDTVTATSQSFDPDLSDNQASASTVVK